MPDIGYTTIGASQRALNSGSCRGMGITMPEAGAAGVTITAHLQDTGAGDTFQAAILDGADRSIVLAESAVRTNISSAGWYTFSGDTLATFAPTNGASYVIVVGSNSTADALMSHDANTASSLDGYAGTADTFDPFHIFDAPAVDATRDYSIYMTYTSAGTSPGVGAMTLTGTTHVLGFAINMPDEL